MCSASPTTNALKLVRCTGYDELAWEPASSFTDTNFVEHRNLIICQQYTRMATVLHYPEDELASIVS